MDDRGVTGRLGWWGASTNLAISLRKGVRGRVGLVDMDDKCVTRRGKWGDGKVHDRLGLDKRRMREKRAVERR